MRVLISQILTESSVITTKNTVTTAQNLQRTLAVQGRGRGEKKLHKCNFCSKPFITEQGLKIHVARWCVSYLNKNILKTKKSQERLAQEILLHSQDPHQQNHNYETSTMRTTASTSMATSDTNFALIPGTRTTVTETKETSEPRRSARVPKPKIKLEQTDNVKNPGKRIKKRKNRRISKAKKAVIKSPQCYPNQILPVSVPVSDLKRYKCKSCPRRFFSLEDCNFHETLHAGNYDRNFHQASVPVPVVQNIDHQWVPQEKHRDRDRNRDRPKKNNKLVPSSFSNSNYESVSMENFFICKLCPSTYRNKKRLRRHMKWRHPKDRQSEIRNINIRHSGSYSHNSGNGGPISTPSDSNPTVTTAEKALKPHLESSLIIPNPNPDHIVELIQPNGERRYSCKLCGEHLKSSKGAVTHGSVHHIGFRPFRCPICFNNFSRDCSLKWHLTIHTGEKKFHCPLCQLSFRYPSGVVRHLKKHV